MKILTNLALAYKQASKTVLMLLVLYMFLWILGVAGALNLVSLVLGATGVIVLAILSLRE